jgi:putative transport protein
MDWLAQSLRQNVEIALFLSIALGYGVGSLRFGGFQLGPVLGTLLAGLLVGQVGIAVPAAMQSAFFLLFLFAIGFRTGPDFFHGLRSSALPQIGLTVFSGVVALGLTWMFAVALALDGGTAAGLLAGALTNSTALGTATRAASALGGEECGTPGQQRRDCVRSHLLPRDAARGVVSAGDWPAIDAGQPDRRLQGTGTHDGD